MTLETCKLPKSRQKAAFFLRPPLCYDGGRMEKTKPKQKRRWPTYLAIGLVLALVLLFVVYPLSVGPVYALALRCEPLLEPANAFYEPLHDVSRAIGAQDLVEDYMRWWIKATAPLVPR